MAAFQFKKTALGFALIALMTSFWAQADEFTETDLQRWQQQFMDTVKQGRELWTSGDLGSNGVTRMRRTLIRKPIRNSRNKSARSYRCGK